MTTVWRPDLKRIRAEIDGNSFSHFDVGRGGLTRRQLRANVEEICGISRWSEDDKGRCHTERWWVTEERLERLGKDHKMSEDQCDRYHAHFDAKEFLTAIMDDPVACKRFNADMIKAIEVTFASTVAASKAAKLTKGESIAMLAEKNFTTIYEVTNQWLKKYGRDVITSPFATAAAWERLKKIDEKLPRIFFNRSKCVKDYLSANEATATYYASFFQAVEDELDGVVFIDQAENILPCARMPGDPHHCIGAKCGARWLANQFSLRWVQEAEKTYELEVVAYSVNTTHLPTANGLREAVEMPHFLVEDVVEFPHYYHVSMSEENMIELARLRLRRAKVRRAKGRSVDKARLKELEAELKNLRVGVGDGLSRRCPHNRVRYKCNECDGAGICEHGRQRHTCKECGGASICEHGRQHSQCKECGGASICEHGRQRSRCKECGGASICEHGRQRTQCKDCGGASFCEHGRIRSSCKDCGGSSICEHGRQRHKCKECGGASICEHGRQRSACKKCGGSQICEHGRQCSTCKECGGASICEHGRQRSACKECGGAQICEHRHRRSTCKECVGGSICEHGRRRSQCKECGGGAICEHDRQRSVCKECGGKGRCKHGRVRSVCKECGGGSICEHGRRRYVCKECGGKGICEHGRQRSTCKVCDGASICNLGHVRSQRKAFTGQQSGGTVKRARVWEDLTKMFIQV
jgi:hypothetical protein